MHGAGVPVSANHNALVGVGCVQLFFAKEIGYVLSWETHDRVQGQSTAGEGAGDKGCDITVQIVVYLMVIRRGFSGTILVGRRWVEAIELRRGEASCLLGSRRRC